MNQASRIHSGHMNRAVRKIGDGWSLLIVWEALNGTTRFDNFQNRLGVARNILSTRLARLVEEGILVKRPVRPGARRLEYRPTARAEALRPALEMIESWARTGTGTDAGEAAVAGTSGEAPLNGRVYSEIRH